MVLLTLRDNFLMLIVIVLRYSNKEFRVVLMVLSLNGDVSQRLVHFDNDRLCTGT